MARIALLLALALGPAAGIAIVGTASAQTAAQDPRSLAFALLDHLDAGRYARAEAMFDAAMAQAVPADKLRAVWESLPAQVGPATGRGDAEVSSRTAPTWYRCRCITRRPNSSPRSPSTRPAGSPAS